MKKVNLDEPTLTIKQAAEKLGVAEYTLRQWADGGEIPGAYKLMGRWRIPVKSLDALIEVRG